MDPLQIIVLTFTIGNIVYMLATTGLLLLNPNGKAHNAIIRVMLLSMPAWAFCGILTFVFGGMESVPEYKQNWSQCPHCHKAIFENTNKQHGQ